MIDLAGQLGFTGNYDVSIDNKGRATVPAAFVKVLQLRHPGEEGNLMATLSLDKSVGIQPAALWMRNIEKLERLPDLDENSRQLLTLMTSFSYPVSMDANNRIRLPQQLMDLCGLEKEVKVIGKRSHFELWERGLWEAYAEKALKKMSETASKVLNLK